MSSTTGKSFIDTNVLVYASDDDTPAKQQIARTLIAEQGGSAVISTQVLQEYFVAATRKLGVAPLHAKEVINGAQTAFETIVVTPQIINRAVDGSVLWQVSFWDALVLACAEDAACAVVFSEDLNSGQRYGGVRVQNPFAGI
ncbi:MAG: PIN domain-containing protein [Spirochaetaceae bacterium]|nr:MAG: PIN domain-containing protein [Spirochaetaceae bacterium]